MTCLPVGIPSLVVEEVVRKNWQNSASRPLRALRVINHDQLPAPFLAELRSRLPEGMHLFGASPLLTSRLYPTHIAQILRCCTDLDRAALADAALPLFRRCFTQFYWLNYFTAYLGAVHVL